MSFYAEPQYSRSRIDAAGYRAAQGVETEEDINVIENWRASHAQILNTFKQILYNRSRKIDCIVVQRLKRRPTIIDKLSRNETMKVRLSQMQDIAGCRLIFSSAEDIYIFQELMASGKYTHELKYKKDYIEEPKEDGYRGIHEIYSYQVEPKKGHAGDEQPWNGMRVEIQYRTLNQHIWATAVESAGLLTAHNPKFGFGSKAFIDFFRVSSEMMSRHAEGRTASLPGLSNRDLVEQFDQLCRETHILEIFENVNSQIVEEGFEKTSILIFHSSPVGSHDSRTEVRSFESVNIGIAEYNKLEKELAGKADLVLVRADAQESMRSAYRNYFGDTVDFVKMVRSAEKGLK